MHGHGRNAFHNLQLNEFFRQKPNGPTPPSARCGRAGQRSEPGVKLAGKGGLARFAGGLTHQRRVQSFFHKALLEVLKHARTYPQATGDIADLPWIAELTGVAQEQSPRVNEFCRCRFTSAGQLRELLAFRLCKRDFVSVGHPLAMHQIIRLTIRNNTCYMVLVRSETLSGISSLVTPSVGICFERVGRELVTLHSRDAGDFPENRWSISLNHTVTRLLAILSDIKDCG